MERDSLVSVVLIAYNQERFVQEALQSVFTQTYAPLEVILSDDCSTDSTYEIMKEQASVYGGRVKKIVVNQNRENLGLAGNLNQAFALTSGQFIVVQAGDDISAPDRVEKLARRWRDRGAAVDLVCSYFEEIDESSRLTGYIEKGVVFLPDTSSDVTKWRCGATGACAAYSRRLFEKYGPIRRTVISEDWVYSFRAWLESGIAVVEEPLVRHRTHDASIYVMHKNVDDMKERTRRRQRRRQGAENRYAIAEEWLGAWRVAKGECKDTIERRLQKLAKIRELELRAFDMNRMGALNVSVLLLLGGGGIRNALRVFVRHVLRWS